MEQYFSGSPASKDEKKQIEVEIANRKFKFFTNNGVFSKDKIDFGSKLLIETFLENNKILSGCLLDIGCGYGVVGISISSFFKGLKIIFSDVNERALDLTAQNVKENKLKDAIVLKSNLYEDINSKFEVILSNPPIRAGKETVFKCYEGAFKALNDNGILYVVIQKKQGADSSIKKLIDLFGNCTILNKKAGYNILSSKKLKSL